MFNSDLQKIYNDRKSAFDASLQIICRKINLISNVRLASAALFLLVVYFGITHDTRLLYSLIPILIVFFWLMARHSKLFEEKTHLENLVEVNAREIKALNGDMSSFANGAQFIDTQHAYTHDLDIFGEGSFFQAINRCNTSHGQFRFAEGLSGTLGDRDRIVRQQEAIRELHGKIDFRQHVSAAGLETKEQVGDREELLQWLSQPTFLYQNKVWRIILIALPAITFMAVIGAFFSPVLKAAAILLALTQWTILGFFIKRVNATHESVGRKKNILENYSRILSFLQREKFESASLRGLSSSAQQADQKLNNLASLVSSFNARTNMIMTLLVNSVLMYDLQHIFRLERWKTENANNLRTWLEAVCSTEVLCTWGTYAFNHPQFIYPEVSNDLQLRATAMGHPLIDPQACITNDVSVGKDSSILIITGANMAGKSTFLRTIGINIVIALNGGPVFASSFHCPLILLRTGMRTADSLKDHQSYFYAELNRLKSIVDQLRSKQPILILLDEILKGTNSTDKQAGSIALVKQLVPHPCLAFIATHDLALGELEQEFPQHVKNYHFEPNIENDQLSFDYKLKRGIAEKMNATFLMKKMGIIPA